ncbi:unnamed protein product, partial [Urochloa humidicola]
DAVFLDAEGNIPPAGDAVFLDALLNGGGGRTGFSARRRGGRRRRRRRRMGEVWCLGRGALREKGRGMGSKSKKTASSHTTEAETGTHSFKVVGYTLKKGIGIGKPIRSGIFNVGGYHWVILFFPDGFIEKTQLYVSIYLQ